MPASAKVGDIIQKVAIFGVAGWFAENAICQQDRYSTVFRGVKIPFMPVYAANGIVLTAASSYISKWPWIARGIVYSLLGTGVEWLGCQVDRQLLGGRAMYVPPDALTQLSSGCVSFTRSAVWGGMGLIAEKV